MADCNANEQALLIGATVQPVQNNNHSETALSTENTMMHYFRVTFVSIDAANYSLAETDGCNDGYIYAFFKSYPNDKADHELERTYMCGNCKQLLRLVPSEQEYDLERQLNLQRIQQQIELEALQHKQRMNHLRTLLLS